MISRTKLAFAFGTLAITAPALANMAGLENVGLGFNVESIGFGIVLLFIGLFISLMIYGFWAQFRRIARMRRMDYEWYKAEHPKTIQGNRVSCYSCNNTRIQVRGLMRRTYMREHFCTQCGKTLYYSPEPR